jgi:predicted outer membrane protein
MKVRPHHRLMVARPVERKEEVMKRPFVLAACILPLLAAPAAGQRSIVPDPLPRLPPQPSQGLPLKDVRFLEQATEYSTLQMEIGELAAENAADESVRRLGNEIAADHQQIKDTLTELAEGRAVEMPEHSSGDAWRRATDQLQEQSGEDFDRTFLDLQLRIGQDLVDLYQTQASHSPDTGLASFAITTLVRLQQHFATVQQLGAAHGLSADTVGQPPQY